MAKLRKKALTVLKVVISLVLIYFIFTKLNFQEVFGVIKETNPFYLLLALLMFVVSKILAAFRLNGYFHELQINLTQKSNLQLYLLGMFYNLFLPGGIGGDAYKGYVITKRFEAPTKRVVSVLVLDRLSGLLLLFAYACILAICIDTTTLLAPYRVLFVIALVLAFLVFFILNKKLFPYVFPVYWKSIGYSSLVQLAQLASVFFILNALHVEINVIAYLFIFLISSIISVIPLTIGGIGSREVTFFYGASLLSLNESTSVGISMIFFVITATVSLFGIIYHFKKPDLQTTGS